MSEPTALLRVSGLQAGYGDVQVLWGVDLTVRAGEIACVVGSNGAGKTTLLRTISGLLQPTAGSIVFGDTEIGAATPETILRAGIAHVPEGRRLFRGLSVRDNLLLGAYLRRDSRAEIQRDLEEIYGLFPILAQRSGQDASTLSGGEQQMCAIGRALMSGPKLLLLDEPSAGLAPVIVQSIFDVIRRMSAEGYTVLIVEQNVQQVLKVVDRAYLLETGRIRASGPAAELLASDDIRRAYLGV